MTISIHKALASLDRYLQRCPNLLFLFQSTRLSRASTSLFRSLILYNRYFNPQGSREPRPLVSSAGPGAKTISIHKALASLDANMFSIISQRGYFNPQGSREPRRSSEVLVRNVLNFNPQGSREPRQQNYPTIPPHPPNFLCIMSSPPYFNLLHPFTQPIFTAFPLFFRCESPRHFMLAWHSHLV